MDLNLLATCFLLALCLKDVDGLKARLVQGTNNSETSKGRLEILHNGAWSTVCDDRFGKTEAQVACRMLGFNTVRSLAVRSSMYGQGSGTILLDDVRCQGSETDLLQCQHRGLYTHNCKHDEDVGVICSDQREQMRLTGSQLTDRGRVEIQLGSEWFTMCVPDDNFPKVVCRQLGLPMEEASIIAGSLFGPSKSQQLMVHFACKGHETSILDCEQLTDIESCGKLDVGVICFQSVQSIARLVQGTSPFNGLLEVLYNESYAPVLTHLFRYYIAPVACRTLGFNSSRALAVDSSMFKSIYRNQFIHMDCKGTESSLTQCPQRVFGDIDFQMSYGFGVICSNPPSLLIHPGGIMYPFTEGTNVTLKCGYGHWTLYNVTWPEKAGGVSNGSELRIDNVTRTHTGRLVKCEAMSKTENFQLKRLTSDTLELQVYYQPSIQITSDLTTCRPLPPVNVCVVTHNTSVTIVCDADSNPPPANITWSGPVSSGTQELHLTPANSSTDEGLYTCSVFTQSRDKDERLPLFSSYTFAVVIQDRPAVLSFQLNDVDNQTVTVSENSRVKMSCLASGRPNMTIMKELNKEKLQIQSQEDIKSIKGEKSDLNHSISNVGCQQSGDYRCEVNNELGNDSQTVRLLVQCAPKTETQVALPSVDISNYKGNLSIKMTSYPTPHVTSVTYKPVDGKDRPSTSLLNNKLHVTCMSLPVAPALVTCDLSVANVTLSDKGLYTMVFSNSLGNTSFNFLLTFKGLGMEFSAQSTFL